MTFEQYEQAWFDAGGIDPLTSFAHSTLKDCPICKFGTVDVQSETKAVCADCGAEFTPKPKAVKRPKKMSEVVP